jgi:hypothetical protein
MKTYNHPLSYISPEIKVLLAVRNELDAPIHLMLIEITNIRVEAHSLTILWTVVGQLDKFVCKNLQSSYVS